MLNKTYHRDLIPFYLEQSEPGVPNRKPILQFKRVGIPEAGSIYAVGPEPVYGVDIGAGRGTQYRKGEHDYAG